MDDSAARINDVWDIAESLLASESTNQASIRRSRCESAKRKGAIRNQVAPAYQSPSVAISLFSPDEVDEVIMGNVSLSPSHRVSEPRKIAASMDFPLSKNESRATGSRSI